MNKKLIALLGAIGLTHEALNSPDRQTRDEARHTLAAAYPTAYVISEDAKCNELTFPVEIDGVKCTKPTNANLTAVSFADSAHGLINFNFVSLDKLDNIIPVSETAVSTKEVKTGKIGSVTTKAEKKGKQEEKANIQDNSIAEAEAELRPLSEIAEGETEPTAEAPAAVETPSETPSIKTV